MTAATQLAPTRSLTVEGRTIQILGAFRSEEQALSFAERRAGHTNAVIQGDCPWYWVVTPADAERLERAGYERLTRSAC